MFSQILPKNCKKSFMQQLSLGFHLIKQRVYLL